MPVSWICGCRMNFDQYFVVLGRRFFYILELKNIGGSVFCVNDSFHEFPPSLVWLLNAPRRSLRLGVYRLSGPAGRLCGFSLDSAARNLPFRSRLHRSSFRNLAYAGVALYLLRLVHVDHSLS